MSSHCETEDTFEDDDLSPPAAAVGAGAGAGCHRLVADAGAAGVRLDKWLSTSLPDLSRARLQMLVRSGLVEIDGRTIVDPALRIKPGQTACVREPVTVPDAPAPLPMPLDVLHEDEHLIVVNKPPGLVVHPGAGNPDRTLVNGLLHHCGGRLSTGSDPQRPGIVHRLDKDTSGVLVAAKTDAAHEALAGQFAARLPGRTYLALVWGTPMPPAGTIEGQIGRHPKNRQKMAVLDPGAGKYACTHYRTLEVFCGGEISLVECRLETGRTHQVRVHLSSCALPLVGDPLYGRKSVPRAWAGRLRGFERQALHAVEVAFTHPVTGETLRFRAEPPEDMGALIETIRRNTNR
ncbi:RluA family pseudouridine synthase [Phaeovibrio sulfidiphilus]|uniref:Pseudouridine synthase n=1 Tax=Phaeovibrio sulfidiphilus TaxID=1220600 RepID=A0A8J6YJS1_9PROT|nr:RluA family pseudouridine synthase [Phaeovibrio sulfidiphilus]MBE1237671.1 RluA family pseudouridine synthase [Phaeovibrio sulfidiphilus]